MSTKTLVKVGKLYSCEDYFLMLYPDKKAAARACASRRAIAAAERAAAFWSNRLGKAVSFIEKNIPILILNNEEEYIEVLAGDKKGWIIVEDWLELKEIDYA